MQMHSLGIKTMNITTITEIQTNKEIKVGDSILKVAGITETRTAIIHIKIQITTLRIMEIEVVLHRRRPHAEEMLLLWLRRLATAPLWWLYRDLTHTLDLMDITHIEDPMDTAIVLEGGDIDKFYLWLVHLEWSKVEKLLAILSLDL